MNNALLKLFTFFATIIIIVIVLYYHGQSIRSKHSVAIGRVLSYTNGGRGNTGPGIYFEYFANGVHIKSSGFKRQIRYGSKGLVGHFFPVVYRKEWYGYFDIMLITPYDFEYYGYTFPDSLRWVLPYVNDY